MVSGQTLHKISRLKKIEESAIEIQARINKLEAKKLEVLENWYQMKDSIPGLEFKDFCKSQGIDPLYKITDILT